MKNKKLIIGLVVGCIVLIALGIGGFFVWQKYFNKSDGTIGNSNEVLVLDSKKEATHISKTAGADGAYFVRGFDIVWNSIEPKEGQYIWHETDFRFNEMSGDDVYALAIIWPYANWDQNTCHTGEKYLATGHLKRGGEDLMMGAPCNYDKYQTFLKKVIERYDGDGVDDMPGLKTPVKYWEVLNEPSMHGGTEGGAGEDLKFFVGTSAEYLEILKKSYAAIKEADPSSKVLHAGMAGMHGSFKDFWGPIYAGGAGDYFDIANIHSISTTTEQEDLYIIKFKEYLKSFGIAEKPIWVTEAQYGSLQEKPKDLDKFNELIARSITFALAQGADKIFMIENWVFWDNNNQFEDKEEDDNKNYLDEKKEEEIKDDFKEKQELDLTSNTTHSVYLNLVDKLGSFDKVETLSEKYNENENDHAGATSTLGQYKFTNGNDIVYVLWGSGGVPSEISGKVTVTDIYGSKSEKESKDISLTNSPIFIEVK